MEFDVKQGFRLADSVVYPDLNRLVSRQGSRALEGKVMAVLVALARSPGRVLSRNELLDEIWPNQTVADGVLTRAIHELRRELGDTAQESHVIETVPRRGYRLLVRPQPVEALPAPAATNRTGWRIAIVLAASAVVAAILFMVSQPEGEKVRMASIAVLPFANMTGLAANDYVGDGLAEEVIHLIARQRELAVAARTSSFALRHSGLTAEEIGRRLDVHGIIEGSVRQEHGVLRIAIQLIDTRTGLHQGSVTLDVSEGDLFSAQEKIGKLIVGMLADAGADVLALPAESSRTVVVKAYDNYLKGRAALQTRSAESLATARIYFEEALHHDEQFAPAFAGLAQLFIVSRVYLQADSESSLLGAERASAAALALDPDNIDALVVSAAVAAERQDFATAMGIFERCLTIEPGNAQVRQWYGETLAMLGYTSAARENIETALRLNPLAGSTSTVRARAATWVRDDAKLLPTARQADALGAMLVPRELAVHFFRQGDAQGFGRELRRYHLVVGISGKAADALAYAMTGQITRDELLTQLAPLGVPHDNYFARELAILGMPEDALVALLSGKADISYISDIWMPEFKAVRALGGFGDYVVAAKLDRYWYVHGLPDVCNGGDPELFCSRFSVSPAPHRQRSVT